MKNIVYLIVTVLLVGGIIFMLNRDKPAPAPTLDKEKERSFNFTGPNVNVEIKRNGPPKTYKEALDVAKITKQKILVVFTADWCSPCKKLKADTLDATEIKELLIPYIVIYIDTDNNKELAHRFNVESLPSYFVIDAEKVIKAGSGLKSPGDFKLWLK